mmetsp:Transcript_24311/g.60918  ORF Transcript_24311/g.60918 Transcript_24311/m.60918 type:complete len:135 (-) Transcript_24311:62-466(-)|eukprot:CAMPEP_0177643916 /NCGR_PEP_ID=MMETSP0447-20121125/8405_1 /TAXON_ID=0 /ORGANISM="Stygamoeba regulata, Strain BSH-02190019" /LENGTH=134 /DNA_ID=CAMNT_0019146233 /DNA_START=321 /DNA_END=725 /DNA_ORIENTATION=+
MEIIPLIEAAKRGNEDQMSELLAGGASISQVDGLGNNALHWAASGGHVAAVQLALKSGCDVNAQNKGGDTALHKASWRNHPEACQLLVDAGADRELTNKEGKSAYDLARNAEVKKVVAPAVEMASDDEYDDESD